MQIWLEGGSLDLLLKFLWKWVMFLILTSFLIEISECDWLTDTIKQEESKENIVCSYYSFVSPMQCSPFSLNIYPPVIISFFDVRINLWQTKIRPGDTRSENHSLFGRKIDLGPFVISQVVWHCNWHKRIALNFSGYKNMYALLLFSRI